MLNEGSYLCKKKKFESCLSHAYKLSIQEVGTQVISYLKRQYLELVNLFDESSADGHELWSQYYNYLEFMYARVGKLEEASFAKKLAKDHFPNCSMRQLGVVTEFMNHNNHKHAIVVLRLLQNLPCRHDVDKCLQECFAIVQDVDKHMEISKRVCEYGLKEMLLPDQCYNEQELLMNHVARANFYIQTAKPKAALHHINTASLFISCGSCEELYLYFHTKGTIWTSMGKFWKAYKSFSMCIRLCPDCSLETYATRISLAIFCDKYKIAVRHCDELLQKDPSNMKIAAMRNHAEQVMSIKARVCRACQAIHFCSVAHHKKHCEHQ